jgi:hypothetical protein
MAILIRCTHTTSGTSTRFPSRASAIQLVCQTGGSEESPKCGLLRCVGLILTNIRSRKVPITISESSKFLWDAATVGSREREGSFPHSGPHSGPQGLDPGTLGLKGTCKLLLWVGLAAHVVCLQGNALSLVGLVSWCCRNMRPKMRPVWAGAVTQGRTW